MNKDYQEDLNFDRKTECDWCGENKIVSICHYGTTHYNRLICKDCAKKINQYQKNFGYGPYFNEEKLKEE